MNDPKEEIKRAASKADGVEEMDTGEAKKDEGKEETKPSTANMEVDEPKKEKEKPKDEPEPEPKKAPEPRFQMLENPARAMRPQLKVITLPESSGYRPLKEIQHGGIVMLRFLKPGEEEQVVELMDASGPKLEEEDELPEPSPPEPFEYIE